MNRRSILWATFLLVLIVTVTVGAQTIGVPSWVGNLLSGQFDLLSGSLVDDSCSFATASCGKAYYDLFTFENRTLEQDQDTVKNGQ